MVLAAIAAAGLGFVSPSFAQFDHLKCYTVSFKKGEISISPHAFNPLVLIPFQNPPFTPEDGCQLLPKRAPRPRFFCVPVDKQPRLEPRGMDLKDDYLLYLAKCPPQDDFRLGVFDQFVRGTALVHRKLIRRLILVPAQKVVQPRPCGLNTDGTCGGACPNPGEECVAVPGPTPQCACKPPTTCTMSTAGGCTGSCAVATESCKILPGTNSCGCSP